jgi:hypothetical protein
MAWPVSVMLGVEGAADRHGQERSGDWKNGALTEISSLALA